MHKWKLYNHMELEMFIWISIYILEGNLIFKEDKVKLGFNQVKPIE